MQLSWNSMNDLPRLNTIESCERSDDARFVIERSYLFRIRQNVRMVSTEGHGEEGCISGIKVGDKKGQEQRFENTKDRKRNKVAAYAFPVAFYFYQTCDSRSSPPAPPIQSRPERRVDSRRTTRPLLLCVRVSKGGNVSGVVETRKERTSSKKTGERRKNEGLRKETVKCKK